MRLFRTGHCRRVIFFPILAALFIISQMRQFDDFLTNLTGGSNSTTTMAIKIVAFIVIAYLVIPSCE